MYLFMCTVKWKKNTNMFLNPYLLGSHCQARKVSSVCLYPVGWPCLHCRWTARDDTVGWARSESLSKSTKLEQLPQVETKGCNLCTSKIDSTSILKQACEVRWVWRRTEWSPKEIDVADPTPRRNSRIAQSSKQVWTVHRNKKQVTSANRVD